METKNFVNQIYQEHYGYKLPSWILPERFYNDKINHLMETIICSIDSKDFVINLDDWIVPFRSSKLSVINPVSLGINILIPKEVVLEILDEHFPDVNKNDYINAWNNRDFITNDNVEIVLRMDS